MVGVGCHSVGSPVAPHAYPDMVPVQAMPLPCPVEASIGKIQLPHASPFPFEPVVAVPFGEKEGLYDGGEVFAHGEGKVSVSGQGALVVAVVQGKTTDLVDHVSSVKEIQKGLTLFQAYLDGVPYVTPRVAPLPGSEDPVVPVGYALAPCLYGEGEGPWMDDFYVGCVELQVVLFRVVVSVQGLLVKGPVGYGPVPGPGVLNPQGHVEVGGGVPVCPKPKSTQKESIPGLTVGRILAVVLLVEPVLELVTKTLLGGEDQLPSPGWHGPCQQEDPDEKAYPLI